MEPYQREFENLIESSLSQNTWSVYDNAVQSFEKFRMENDFDIIWPAPLSHLINFIVHLASNKYSVNTVKSYVAGISFHMKIKNQTDTSDSFIIQKLLKGMSIKYKRDDIRKPITVEILKRIIGALPFTCFSKYESDLFSAIFALTFCAFLRIGESVESNKSNHTLQIGDVSLNSEDKTVKVTVQSSKTDQYGKKSQLTLSKEFVDIPMYDILSRYLDTRPKIQGNLFCHFNHSKVTRNQVVSILKSSLKFVGINENDYNTHSFRIGACTYAKQLGKSENEIMTMGRWNSKSYQRYIRI